ncbi:hypothetical protein NL676_006767 [Syzygium grande]|nr:hypothetical protein NL676_006767 [Syzygium grande]
MISDVRKLTEQIDFRAFSAFQTPEGAKRQHDEYEINQNLILQRLICPITGENSPKRGGCLIPRVAETIRPKAKEENVSKALNVKNRGLNFGNSKETALSRNSSLLRARNDNSRSPKPQSTFEALIGSGFLLLRRGKSSIDCRADRKLRAFDANSL